MELNRLPDMVNIGKELEKLLISVGITTPEELVNIGSVEAVKRMKLTGNACYNKLYALEGAIRDMRWHGISKDDREKLKMQYKQALMDINETEK